MAKNNQYGEMVALFEYIDKIRNEKPKKSFFKREKKRSTPDEFFDELRKFEDTKEKYEKWMKQQAKEEKKEEKKGWDKLSPLQQAAYLTFGMQIMSLLYFSFLIKLLK